MIIELNLNGKQVAWEISPGDRLLDALRMAPGAVSVKRGCESGDCGSCCVLLNGQPVNTCVVPAVKASGQEITTLEGLAENELMKKLQSSFLDSGAVQCGYCTPGMLIAIWARLNTGGTLTEQDVRHALSGNLCRCTGYAKPVEAILKVWEDKS